jgi:hypothetical protein
MIPKKLQAMYSTDLHWVYTNCSYSHVQNIVQPHRQSMKLRNMIISTRIKVLIKFGTPEMICVELRAKKLWMCTIVNAHILTIILMCTHTEVTNTLSTVYTTLDYEFRHENKGTGLILVPRKCGVYKWHQKSYKICTVQIYIEYTQKAHSHTQRSHYYYVHCLHHSGLWM